MATRRDFLRWLAAGAGFGLIAGCGESGPTLEQIEAEAARYDADLDCSDVTGLYPAELRTREDNAYRDRSSEPGRYCFNCSNYVEPTAPAGCGGCRTVKGPIHPLGWCTAWTERRG